MKFINFLKKIYWQDILKSILYKYKQQVNWNAMKRKVTLRILLQRASIGEKEQRILKWKWPWSGVPRSFDLGYNGFTRYSDKV